METMYEIRLINDYNASLAIYFSHFYHHSKTMIVINNKKKYAEIFTSPWYADNEDGMDPPDGCLYRFWRCLHVVNCEQAHTAHTSIAWR
jgi:hypothetical protein